MPDDIVVVLPVAGEGERCWPLRHKQFLSFVGESLISRCLHQLEKAQFHRIVLVVNSQNRHLAETLISQFPSLSLSIVEQKKGKGIGAAILSVSEIIQKRIVIISPHDVVEETLVADFATQIKKNPEALVVGKTVSSYFPGGYLEIANGKVDRITEKPKPGKNPSDTVALVYYYFQDGKKLIDSIKSTINKGDDQFESAISDLLTGGLQMEHLSYKGYWGYLKYSWDVLSIMEFFLSRIRPANEGARVEEGAKIIGNVHMEKGVVVHSGAVVSGPCFIGEGSIIGNNALVRNSHIGKHCMVGFGSEIARSYVGDSCWFHTNYVGDSVLSSNVSIGAGTVVANFRLDEKEIFSYIHGEKKATGRIKFGTAVGSHVRIGVQVSTMPGVKIGTNACVGPGVLVHKDIPDGKTLIAQLSEPILLENSVDIKQLERHNGVVHTKDLAR